MASRTRSFQGWQVLLFWLLMGGIIGGWIGEAIVNVWPALSLLGRVQSIGLPAFTMDLHVFSLTFGFMLNLNFFTIAGFVVAWALYRRLLR